MKRVCLNRLKNEAIALSNLVTSLDTLGPGIIQEVFDSIFKLCMSDKDAMKTSIQTSHSAISDPQLSTINHQKRSTKEVLKMVVVLMIEDIWQNFDNYKLQSQVVTKHKQSAVHKTATFEEQLEQLVEPSQKVVELRLQPSTPNSVCKGEKKQQRRYRSRFHTTDNEQVFAQPMENQVLLTPSASLVSPADLQSSDSEYESHSLASQTEDLFQTNTYLNKAPKQVQSDISKQAKSQISEELEQLLRKNILEFENNQNFRSGISDTSSQMNGQEKVDSVSKQNWNSQKQINTTKVDFNKASDAGRAQSSQNVAELKNMKYIDDLDSDEENDVVEQQNQAQELQIIHENSETDEALNNPVNLYQIDLNEKQKSVPVVKNSDKKQKKDKVEVNKISVVQTKDPHKVIDKYQNLPFMPQKNEQSDRRDILLRSKEMNPLVSIMISTPLKNQNKVCKSSPSPITLKTNEIQVKQKSGKQIKSFVKYGASSVNATTNSNKKKPSASAKK